MKMAMARTRGIAKAGAKGVETLVEYKHTGLWADQREFASIEASVDAARLSRP